MTTEAPPTAERFWSATTLVDNGTPSPGLIGWTANTIAAAGVDYHEIVGAMLAAGDREGAIRYLANKRWEASEKAAARGTLLHKVAEMQALGLPLPNYDESVRPYVDQFLRYLDDHQPEYLLSEAPVYNTTYSYGGTLDAIVKVGGAVVVQDVKTNYKPPEAKSRPPYPEIALQLVAYKNAEWVGLRAAMEREEERGQRYYLYDESLPKEPMPETEGALALIVTPYDYILKPIRVDEEVWTSFLYVREAARWTLEKSKRVIGPTIDPPKKEEA